MSILVLLNNFMHDFSAAGWLFGTVILWVMLRKPLPVAAEGRQLLAEMLKTTVWLMRLSVAGIVVFGIVRAIAYKTFEWNAVAGDEQITLLIVKHIILTFVFAIGIYYYLKALRTIRKVAHGETE